MRELNDKVAVITGGGSGIGRGMALAFGEAGMRIVVAEIDDAAAEATASELRGRGVDAVAEHVDVIDRAAVHALADRVFERFGEVHLLCNNAGVTTWGALDSISERDFDWVMKVNLDGVVNGVLAFVPRMARQPGEKHVVNTASTAALGGIPSLGHYVTSKHAVLGLSETLAIEGAARGLGCSVLCPGATATGIVKSARNRQAAFGGVELAFNEPAQSMIAAGLDPEEVGRIVRESVIDGDLYIFTHRDSRDAIEKRYRAMMAAQEKAEKRMAARA